MDVFGKSAESFEGLGIRVAVEVLYHGHGFGEHRACGVPLRLRSCESAFVMALCCSFSSGSCTG